jgi:hypothetical protein
MTSTGWSRTDGTNQTTSSYDHEDCCAVRHARRQPAIRHQRDHAPTYTSLTRDNSPDLAQLWVVSRPRFEPAPRRCTPKVKGPASMRVGARFGRRGGARTCARRRDVRTPRVRDNRPPENNKAPLTTSPEPPSRFFRLRRQPPKRRASARQRGSQTTRTVHRVSSGAVTRTLRTATRYLPPPRPSAHPLGRQRARRQ